MKTERKETDFCIIARKKNVYICLLHQKSWKRKVTQQDKSISQSCIVKNVIDNENQANTKLISS